MVYSKFCTWNTKGRILFVCLFLYWICIPLPSFSLKWKRKGKGIQTLQNAWKFFKIIIIVKKYVQLEDQAHLAFSDHLQAGGVYACLPLGQYLQSHTANQVLFIQSLEPSSIKAPAVTTHPAAFLIPGYMGDSSPSQDFFKAAEGAGLNVLTTPRSSVNGGGEKEVKEQDLGVTAIQRL